MFLSPVKPPYDALEWARKPFAERSRLVCMAWAMQGYGTPIAVYFAYAPPVPLHAVIVGESPSTQRLRLAAAPDKTRTDRLADVLSPAQAGKRS